MLNRNSSARTAAQKSSKCSLLIRLAKIATILMLGEGYISVKDLKSQRKELFGKIEQLINYKLSN